MSEIKNLELIKDFIDGAIYSFNYDILMHTIIIKVKVIEQNLNKINIKIYEIKLNLANEIKYKVLDSPFAVAKLKSFTIEKSKYKDNFDEEWEVYYAKI